MVAALVYAFVLIRRLPELVDQLTWNSDYVSGMVMAQYIGNAGKSGRAIVIQVGYFWFDLATLPLPFHVQVWEYAPFAMAMITLALIAWTAWKLGGRFAAALAASMGLAASPLVLGTQLAQAYHGTTWLGAALLAAYLCAVLSAKSISRAIVVLSIAVALVAGFATASDPLLLPAGDAPFALILLATWWLRRDEMPREKTLASTGTLVGIGVVAGSMLVADRLAGFVSSFPRGLSHFVPPDHLAGNARQLVGGLFEVAGMPHKGSALGIVLGLLLVTAVMLPIGWLLTTRARGMSAAMLAVVGFWSVSAVAVGAAFFFSDIPADFLQNSSRYLISMFYVAPATVPLWAVGRAWRMAVVAAPATLLILANASAVDHDASTGAFEPSFSPSLDAPIAFLEQHHLTRGYAAYDIAAPITLKADFGVVVYPIDEVFVSPDDACGTPVCPFAYNSVSDWYRGDAGPTFILFNPGLYRLAEPPPPSMDVVVTIYDVGDYRVYVFSDDVASHMGTPRRFTRPLF